MREKTKKCKYCQTEMDNNEKICPNCFQKQKKPKWLIIVIILASLPVVLTILSFLISLIFSLFLFPQIEDDIMKSTYCSQAIDCSEPDDSGMSICKYIDDNYEEQIVECYKGE